MVLTWMDGWYKGDEDEAIIDTDVFVENAKKFGDLLREESDASASSPPPKRSSASDGFRQN